MNRERGLIGPPNFPAKSSGELAKSDPSAAALRLDAEKLHKEKVELVYLRLAYGEEDRSAGQDLRRGTGQDGGGAHSDLSVGPGPSRNGSGGAGLVVISLALVVCSTGPRGGL